MGSTSCLLLLGVKFRPVQGGASCLAGLESITAITAFQVPVIGSWVFLVTHILQGTSPQLWGHSDGSPLSSSAHGGCVTPSRPSLAPQDPPPSFHARSFTVSCQCTTRSQMFGYLLS